MSALLIVNADDFGMNHAVNAAVLKALRTGVLTSASLMVTGRAAGEAVRLARENPQLAVGLHVAVGDARSALSRELIPGLVDKNSRFHPSPVICGLKYTFDRRCRSVLRKEIEAQFHAFAETGLPLSHVDGHQHLHAHPAVLPIVLDLAKAHGAKGIRVPRDPVWLSLRLDCTALGYKLGATVGTAFLSAVCRRRVLRSGLSRCDYTLGSLMCGMMNPAFATRALSQLRCRSAEMFFHPALPPCHIPLGPNPGDLQTLLSPELKDYLSNDNWRLTNYTGLARHEGVAVAEPA
jgi:hopanoid biosynthesis associated protein HpnK